MYPLPDKLSVEIRGLLQTRGTSRDSCGLDNTWTKKPDIEPTSDSPHGPFY